MKADCVRKRRAQPNIMADIVYAEMQPFQGQCRRIAAKPRWWNFGRSAQFEDGYSRHQYCAKTGSGWIGDSPCEFTPLKRSLLRHPFGPELPKLQGHLDTVPSDLTSRFKF